MKAYLPFGDWSNDGHGRCHRLLVEINSMEDVSLAQDKIRKEYGEYFFYDFADDYCDDSLSYECWKALFDHGIKDVFPAAMVSDEFESWKEIEERVESPEDEYNNFSVSLEFVEQAFIWLLNKFGAHIELLQEDQKIPEINGYNCKGFQNVGYGCFYG